MAHSALEYFNCSTLHSLVATLSLKPCSCKACKISIVLLLGHPWKRHHRDTPQYLHRWRTLFNHISVHVRWAWAQRISWCFWMLLISDLCLHGRHVISKTPFTDYVVPKCSWAHAISSILYWIMFFLMQCCPRDRRSHAK